MNSITYPKPAPFFSLLVLRSLRHLARRRGPLHPAAPVTRFEQMELPALERRRLVARGRAASSTAISAAI